MFLKKEEEGGRDQKKEKGAWERDPSSPLFKGL
jgi:hypothetical protein